MKKYIMLIDTINFNHLQLVIWFSIVKRCHFGNAMYFDGNKSFGPSVERPVDVSATKEER